MIDYAIKTNTEKEINIENINISNNYFENNNPQEKSLYLTGYKYPYISSEILSHDFPFLLDKLIISNTNNSNFLKFGTNTSCIFGDISNNDLNFYDELSDENFVKKEGINNIKEEKDEIFEEFQENCENIEIFDNDINLELIDYIFNISFNNELNGVQGGYFVKIIRSLMHSLYSPNKSIILLKYILFRKNSEILNNIIKNIKYFYFQEILYEILIFNDEDNNLSINGTFEKKKINIIINLMNNLKNNVDGIKEVICDYIINCKNEELLINENTLNKCFSDCLFNNESILDKFCVISSHILKEYKYENYVLNNNNSKSYYFKNSSKCILNNSVISLNIADKDIIISKFNKIIKNFELNVLKSTLSKINFLSFVFDFISLTRGNELLNNLKSIKYFSFLKNIFYESKNDIVQTIIINEINLLTKDSQAINNNNNWFNELFINNGFIEEALNIKNISYSNYGICSNNLFIHISIIFDILIKNLSEFLSNNNIYQKVQNFYEKEIKKYLERMNKPIYEVSNSFNLSQILNKNFDNENELKVDEVDNIEPNNNTNVNLKNSKATFYLTEESYIKKHNLNSSTKESISGNNDNNDGTKLFFDENLVQSIEEIKK